MSRPLKCLDCPESEVYSSENELEAHIAADHIKMLPYGCGMCKYGKFPTESALFNHHSEVHGNISNITSVFHGSRELPAQRKELAKKLEKCIEATNSLETGDPPPKLEITIDETPCDPVKCLDCPESGEFHSKEKLEAHIADVHLKSFPYKCEICKHAMFPTEYMVRCHYQEDHKRSGEFNLIMRCSPEIVLERKELARRLEMCCLASGPIDSGVSRPVSAGVTPRRVESPLKISPVKVVERESDNQKSMDLPAKPAIEPMSLASSPIPEVFDFEHEVPRASSSVSSVGESPRQLPSSSGLEPQAPVPSTPVPTRRTSAASVTKLPSNYAVPQSKPRTPGVITPVQTSKTASTGKLPSTSAVPRSQPQASGTSTTVPTKITSTAGNGQSTPIISPVTSATRRKSSRVSKKKVYADFVAEPQTVPTSPVSKSVTAQRLGKRQGPEMSSEIEKRVKRILLEASRTERRNAPEPSTTPKTPRTRTLNYPDIDMTAGNSVKSEISRHPNLDLVKNEYPPPYVGMNQVKVENSAGPSTSSNTIHGAAWPLPYPLKVEESEDVQDNYHDQYYRGESEVDPEEDPEEQGESEEEENSEDDDDEDFVLVKKKSRGFTCTVCSVTVKSMGSRLTHACTHGNFTLYECKMCNQKFTGYNINDVKRHIQNKHKVMDDKVIMKNISDLREKLRAKITKLKDMCFPLKE